MVKIDSKKIAAIFFIVLLVGSTLAFGVLNIFNPQQQTLDIPQERILNYKLTEEQKLFLLSRGFTIIEYSYPEFCFECIEVKNQLEQATQNSDGQIFFQELTSTQNNVPIVWIENYYNGFNKTIENPSAGNATSEVCNALVNVPIWCISGRV